MPFEVEPVEPFGDDPRLRVTGAQCDPTDVKELDIVFGEDSIGDTPEERAESASRRWVRSQDQLAFYDKPEKQTGMVLSSSEALALFGFQALFNVTWEGSAVLICEHAEPSASIIRVRERLGWSQQELADRAGLDLTQIQLAESSKRCGIHVLADAATALGIDSRKLGFYRFR